MARRTLHLSNPNMHDRQDKTHPLDVSYAQRLLNNTLKNRLNTNFHAGNVDGHYGDATAAAAKRAKFWFGYPKSECDGACGQVLINLLNGTSKMTAIMKWRRAIRQREAASHNGIRDKMVANARWMIANNPSIHYSQGWLRMAGVHLSPHSLPLFTDCSASCTIIAKWSGAPDPNGLGYNGQGYTGTFLTNCIRIPDSAVKRGDFAVFGSGSGHHVAMALVDGGSQLFNHGTETHPIQIAFALESYGQSANGHYFRGWYRIPGLI